MLLAIYGDNSKCSLEYMLKNPLFKGCALALGLNSYEHINVFVFFII